MRQAIGYVVVSCVTMVASWAVSAAPTKQTFTIPKYGELTLVLPDEFVATVEDPKDGTPMRINIVKADYKDFTMVITPVNPPGDKEPATPERVRKMLEVVRVAMKAEAKESDVPVEDLKGPQTVGYFFQLTRQAKKAATLPHATHARIAVGDRLILGVVIVQRLKSGPNQKKGLEMMKKATLAPLPATQPAKG